MRFPGDEEIRTECNLELDYPRRERWVLAVTDCRSRSEILRIEMTQEQFSDLMSDGTVLDASAQLIRSSRHGKKLVVARMLWDLPKEIPPKNWEQYLDEAAQHCGDGWELDRAAFDVHCVIRTGDRPRYSFVIRRWDPM